mgnify:FL=1
MLKLPSYAHFCGDVRVEENCCADEFEGDSNNTTSIEASCCSDIELPNTADKVHQAIQEINWTNQHNVLVPNSNSLTISKVVFNSKTLSLLEYYHHFSPPVQSLHKLYNQYIVYH